MKVDVSNCKTDEITSFVVEKDDDSGEILRSVKSLPLSPLGDDAVRIKVEFSSLNYKDALCATGHPGIARKLPIVPGIDAAGTVVECPSGKFNAGDEVMVFHAEFGTAGDGGLQQIIDVPCDWVYGLPDKMTLRQSMIIGTAGFTAAQSVDELLKHDVAPDSGEIIVTGATGGVGVMAVKLLSKINYSVVAATGKSDKTDWLKSLGADSVVKREDCDDHTDRPLLAGRWAGAVDTVGGNTLATVLRSTKPTGCVTACGMVGGVDLPVTVYPFILRGVTLQGIDTAGISRDYRAGIWNRLANEWSLDGLDELATEIDLNGVEEKIQLILAGKISGRIVVKLN